MVALAVLATGAVSVMAASSAQAGCYSDRPAPSPYRFEGVVTATELGQRVAHVQTDDGRRVVVRGTDATADNTYTTVDRTYLVGHRNQFHPTSASSPYADNVCTATMDLGPAPTASPRAAEPLLADGELQSAGAPWALGAAAGLVLLVVGVMLVGRTRQAARESHREPTG